MLRMPPVGGQSPAGRPPRLLYARFRGHPPSPAGRRQASPSTDPAQPAVRTMSSYRGMDASLELGLALCCHSNATRAPIANPPNSAQLGGSLYHAAKLHPGPRSSVGVWPRTDTHTQTHRREWPQNILRRLRLTQNVIKSQRQENNCWSVERLVGWDLMVLLLTQTRWLVDWFDWRFYVPLDTKQVFSKKYPKPISGLVWKNNLTQQKHTFTNLKKCTIIQNKNKKLNPSIVASYNIRPGNGRAYSGFGASKIVTYLLTWHLSTYLQPQDSHAAGD